MGEIQMPLRYDAETKGRAYGQKTLRYCPQVGLIAIRQRHFWDKRAKGLVLLFPVGTTAAMVDAKFEELGLNRDDFDVQWPGGDHFEIRRYQDGVSLHRNDERKPIYEGSGYGLIEV